MDDKLQLGTAPAPKSQRGLWIVAASLAALLIGYHGWGGDDEAPRAATPSAVGAGAAPRAPAVPAVPNPPQPSEAEALDWPHVSFDDLIQNNPFKPWQALQDRVAGTAEDRAAIDAVAEELKRSREAQRKRDELAQQMESADWKLRLVYHGPQGPAAVIGDQLVRQGDTIHGHRVVSIDRHGVTLDAVPAEPGDASTGGP